MFKFFSNPGHRDFSKLWFGQIISQFGDRIHQLALVGLVAERSRGSVTSLAKLMAFTILPVFIIQPFAGVFVDRWDRRKTMFYCDLLRGLLVLTIPFALICHESMMPIYAVVFLVFCFSRFYVPAKMSMIPDLVDPKSILMANSLVSTTGMIAFVMGCAVGGFLIEWYGARNGFIIDAFTFLFSAGLIFSISTRPTLKIRREDVVQTGKEVVAIEKDFWQDLKEGVRYLWTHKEIRFLIDMMFALLSMAGAVYVVIIVFIQESFGSVTKHLGGLAVCLGVGLFLGALAYGRWGKRVVWYKTIFFCLIASGSLLILFCIAVRGYPDVWLAGVLAGILGFVIGPIFIAANAVAQIVSDEKMRGKVFSALEIVIHFAFLIAMLVSSWLSQIVGTQWILLLAGLATVAIGVLGLIRKEHRGDVLNGFKSGKGGQGDRR